MNTCAQHHGSFCKFWIIIWNFDGFEFFFCAANCSFLPGDVSLMKLFVQLRFVFVDINPFVKCLIVTMSKNIKQHNI